MIPEKTGMNGLAVVFPMHFRQDVSLDTHNGSACFLYF